MTTLSYLVDFEIEIEIEIETETETEIDIVGNTFQSTSIPLAPLTRDRFVACALALSEPIKYHHLWSHVVAAQEHRAADARGLGHIAE